MSRIVKCALCGTKFETDKPRIKYCIDCKDEGKERTRKEWEVRTDYNVKRRLAMQERREKDRQKKEILTTAERKERYQKNEELRAERLAKAKADFMARVKAREPIANMMLYKNTDANYWKWYKAYELQNAEELNKECNKAVNTISIHEPNFENLVVDSIKQTGKIFISTL